MAELIEQRREKSLIFLERLKVTKLLSDYEFLSFSKKRERFEYKLHESGRTLQNYLLYIKDERAMANLIEQRIIERKLPQNTFRILDILNVNIKNLYKEATYRYTGQKNLINNYLGFLQSIEDYEEIQQVFKRLIRFHGEDPVTYLRAINWHSKFCPHKVDLIKEFFGRGQQRHPKCFELYIEFIKHAINEQYMNYDKHIRIAIATAITYFKSFETLQTFMDLLVDTNELKTIEFLVNIFINDYDTDERLFDVLDKVEKHDKIFLISNEDVEMADHDDRAELAANAIEYTIRYGNQNTDTDKWRMHGQTLLPIKRLKVINKMDIKQKRSKQNDDDDNDDDDDDDDGSGDGEEEDIQFDISVYKINIKRFKPNP